MKYWLIILAFLPLFGFGQTDTFDIYSHIDFESRTLGRSTYSQLYTEYINNDYDIDTIYCYSHTDDNDFVQSIGDNTTKVLQIHYPAGCQTGCSGTAGINAYATPQFTTGREFFFSYGVWFSPEFNGGLAGGKLMNLQSEYKRPFPVTEGMGTTDTISYGFTLNFEGNGDGGDSLLWFYIYDRATIGYGETYYTNVRVLPSLDQWYGFTMRMYIDPYGDDDGFVQLFMNGICVAKATGFSFGGNVGAYTDKLGSMVTSFFYGGGGASTDSCAVKYDDFVTWTFTDYARTSLGMPAIGDTVRIGDTILLPSSVPRYCSDWLYCDDYYNGGTYECADTWAVDGGTCDESEPTDTVYGNTYYFSTSGNAGNTGKSSTSPWPFSKLQGLCDTLSTEQDTILFKRGDTFDEFVLNITSKTGITFGAYGTGDNPVLSGYKELSTFTQTGNYWKIVDTDLSDNFDQYFRIGIIQNDWPFLNVFNYIKINGVAYPVGSYPDDWQIYYAFTGTDESTYFEDDVNTFNDHTWDSAIVTSKANANKFLVTSYTSNTATIDNKYIKSGNILEIGDKYYYSNHDSACRDNGDWAYRPDKQRLTIYYDGDLNAQTVCAPINDTVIYLNGCENIKFDGIDLEGGIKRTVLIVGSTDIELNKCNFKYTPVTALYNYEVDGLTVDSCQFEDIGGDALYMAYMVGDYSVTSSYFNRIGIDKGMGYSVDNQYFSQDPISSIYRNKDATTVITKNRIDSVGGTPIQIKGIDATDNNNYDISKNLITNSLFQRCDAGILYLYESGASLVGSNKVIRDNYLYNGDGGTNFYNTGVWVAPAIYLDGSTTGIKVINNVGINTRTGLYLNGTHDNTARLNTFYNNGRDIADDIWAGIYCGEWGEVTATTDCHFGKNTIIARDSLGVGVAWGSTVNPINEQGTVFDTNYYFNPISGASYMFNKLAGSCCGDKIMWDITTVRDNTAWEDAGTYNQASWEYSDLGGSPSITRDQFTIIFYNWSDAAHEFSFGNCTLADTAGTEVTVSAAIQPYCHAVYFYKSGTYSTIDNPVYVDEWWIASEESESSTVTYKGSISLDNATYKGQTFSTIKYRGITYKQ